MDKLKLSLVQSDLHWEDPASNLTHFTTLISGINEETDIILLPEMFTTGFSMQPELFAESPDGAAVSWMREMAAKKNAALCGSMMMKENGLYFNRLVWMPPDGNVQYYNKKHLFRMSDEQLHYTPGNTRMIIPFRGWRIFPLVCYDLRFPAWLRRTLSWDYDLMLFVANWPERRVNHWKTLLQARAIENQCYVGAVNRIGNDGYDVHYSGATSLIDPRGEILFRDEEQAFCRTFTLDKEEVTSYRRDFPVMQDADDFILS